MLLPMGHAIIASVQASLRGQLRAVFQSNPSICSPMGAQPAAFITSITRMTSP
jgi:hypothetical protein